MADTDSGASQVPVLSDRELLIRIDTKLEGVIEDRKDHEARLRTLEERTQHFVSVKALWVGLTGVLGAAATVSSIIGEVFRH